MKADRGITLLQSQRLYNLTSIVVPVASRKLFGPKGRGGNCARRTFQLLSNISFPKIAGEREGGEVIFGLTIFTKLSKFVQFFSYFRKFLKKISYNYYFSNNYVTFFAELHIFFPT
jgi:hypothetical protein